VKKAFKFLVFSTLMAVVVGNVPAFASGVSPLELPVSNDEAMVYISEHEDLGIWGSQLSLQPGKPNANLERDPWIQCESVDDPLCDFEKPNYGPSASINLRYCENADSEDCIAKFRVLKEGKLLQTDFVSYVPGAKFFPSAPQFGLFETGRASIIRVPDAPHGGGDLYLVSARVSSNYEPKSRVFRHNDLYVVIYPFSIKRDFSGPCLWRFEGQCGVQEEFPAEVSFGIEVRVVNQLGGWFLGRMKDPVISANTFSSRNNLIVVDAMPVKVSRFAFVTKKSNLSASDRMAVGNVGGTGFLFRDGPARLGNDGFDNSVFGMLEHFKARVNDTAVAVTSHWRLRTTSRNGGNPCLAKYDRVLGVVSTNATAYDGFAPEYKDGSINYKVAGLHYLPGGKELALGTYDLVMRSETARCLYGFTKAPVSATVTVLGSGDQNIATTVVSEKGGWLKLAAYGFTFSQKEIKVRLTQPFTMAISKFEASSFALSTKQKSEIRAAVAKGKSNPKFTCTGAFRKAVDKPAAFAKAKAVCSFAKSLDNKRIYVVRAEPAKSASSDARVFVSSE
jgi:hypothetical protein